MVSTLGRADERNRLAFVATIGAEICPIDGEDAVVGVKLANANQAQVGKVGMAIGVALGELGELRQVVAAVERQRNEPFPQHGQHQSCVPQMERRLGQHGLAGEQRVALGRPWRRQARSWLALMPSCLAISASPNADSPVAILPAVIASSPRQPGNRG